MQINKTKKNQCPWYRLSIYFQGIKFNSKVTA